MGCPASQDVGRLRKEPGTTDDLVCRRGVSDRMRSRRERLGGWWKGAENRLTFEDYCDGKTGSLRDRGLVECVSL